MMDMNNIRKNWSNFMNLCVYSLILVFIVVNPASAQVYSTDKNHIISKTARVAGIKTSTDMDSRAGDEVATSVSYSDRLGRPTQSIAIGASPALSHLSAKDMVSFTTYDSYGLPTKQHLPYVASTSDGMFKTNAPGDQTTFYNTATKVGHDAAPWSEVKLERSPFKRVEEQGGVGEDAQLVTGKVVKSSTTYNDANDNVYEWIVNSSGGLSYPVTPTQYHFNNTLTVQITKSPDWTGGDPYTSRSYTDSFGRTILTRSYNDGDQNGSFALETYYVYDVAGNLCYTFSPELSRHIRQNNGTLPSQALLDKWATQNTYNSRNRLISSKAPGIEPVYYAYDKVGRLIMSQDGNQRAQDDWTFTKYDRQQRPVLTGVYTHTSALDAAAMNVYVQLLVYITTSTNAWYVEPETSGPHGYSNNVFPFVSNEADYLVVSYYDNYDFNSTWGNEYDFETNSVNTDAYLSNAWGLETGGKIKVLGENKWLKSVKYYDEYLKVIQVVAGNYLDDYERAYTRYSFTGDLDQSQYIYHDDSEDKDITITERYDYDHTGRLLKQWHSMDGEPEVLLAAYAYNELGELIDKSLHSTDNGTNFIQSIDYRYNIKGQLTHINNAARTDDLGLTNDDTNDQFGMELYYNSSPSGLSFLSRPISAINGTTWGNGSMNGIEQRSYGFTYDEVGRLAKATYKEKANGVWNTKVGHNDVERIDYDQNGNIQKLKRKQSINGTATLIDDLSYSYYDNGNQLQSINDLSNHPEGFKDGVELSTEYTYDDNGNLITDNNKFIQSIVYNQLNKPEVITFQSGSQIKYKYDAAGARLQQEVWINSALESTINYSGGFIFEDGALSTIAMPEGRIVVEKVANDYNYDYQYFLKDHLGNTRVVVAPTIRVYIATMETEFDVEEEAQFLNLAQTRTVGYNQTPGGNEAAELWPGEVGPAKALKVYAGDVVDMEVYVRYVNNSNNEVAANTLIFAALAGAYGLSSTGETAQLYTEFYDQFGLTSLTNQNPNQTPVAYLNYIFISKDYQTTSWGFTPMTAASGSGFTKLTANYPVEEEGYLFTWVSHESTLNIPIYFDDYIVTHTSAANVLHADDYYPFGLPIAGSKFTEPEAKENRFLYQGKEWQTALALNLYDFHARQYDPATGRFLGVDPKSDLFPGMSPYNAMLNNPLFYTDPDGECPICLVLIVGAVINIASNWDHISSADSFGQGLGRALGYGAVGAVQGALSTLGPAGLALGGAVGGLGNGLMRGHRGSELWIGVGVGAVSALAGGTAARGAGKLVGDFASPILDGFVKGAVGGAAGGFVGGGVGAGLTGNNILEGAGRGALQGAAYGGISGAAVSSYNAAKAGFSPWTGQRVQSLTVPTAKSLGSSNIPLSGKETSHPMNKVPSLSSGSNSLGRLNSVESVPLRLHSGAQGRHFGRTTIAGRSTLTTNPNALLNDLNSGNFTSLRAVSNNKVLVDFGRIIGNHPAGQTQYGMVHMNNTGQVHIVPANPTQY